MVYLTLGHVTRVLVTRASAILQRRRRGDPRHTVFRPTRSVRLSGYSGHWRVDDRFAGAQIRSYCKLQRSLESGARVYGRVVESRHVSEEQREESCDDDQSTKLHHRRLPGQRLGKSGLGRKYRLVIHRCTWKTNPDVFDCNCVFATDVAVRGVHFRSVGRKHFEPVGPEKPIEI